MKVPISQFSIPSFLTALFALFLVVRGAIAAEEAGAPIIAAPPTGGDAIQMIIAPPDRIPEVDPIALYGNEMIFDVYRKGLKVGEQSMYFSRNAEGDLFVQVRFHLAINVLFITAYTYDYEASEIWRDNQIVALTAHVDDNGKVAATSARLDEGVFKIDGPRGTILADSWVFPTNHWHRGQVESSVLLNTLTGALAHVRVERRGIDKVSTGSGGVDAERFSYTGDLHDTDVWYDARGRWVKMRFKAKDGSTIEFACRKCSAVEEG